MSKQEEIKEMEINGVKFIRADHLPAAKVMGDRVLVRTRNAGIHVGTLEERDDIDTVLRNANRIWRWRGAHDLSYVAMNGVNRKEYTRISCMVPSITLTTSDVCEIIPVANGVDLTEVGIDEG